MKNSLYRLIITITLLIISGCDQGENSNPKSKLDFVVLDQELTQLKQDFNRRKDQLRLFFIVGPTCGICLRGMADLQDEFLREMQNDPRVHTFVIHVPALDAEEKMKNISNFNQR